MYLDENYAEKHTISWLIEPVIVERPQIKNFNVDFAHLLFIAGSSYLAHICILMRTVQKTNNFMVD